MIQDINSYYELFKEVQLSAIFEDSKTFPDCTCKLPFADVNALYLSKKDQIDFDLKAFVFEYFERISSEIQVSENTNKPIEHINNLWPLLTKKSIETTKYSTYLTLPNEFVVPGGRFQEVYYWDSYFTMLGLKISKKYALIEGMVANFAYLINTYGHIPNGNRSYYLSRSQPPYFSLMLDLLAEIKGDSVYIEYLNALESEYKFWMNGHENINAGQAFRRIVKLPSGELLNRYFDDSSFPRPESFKEDLELFETNPNSELYVNLRAACESGWDFSSRWFKDVNDFSSIQTIDLLPIDLNCLLYHLEVTLDKSYTLAGNTEQAKSYNKKAFDRKSAINSLFYSHENSYYMDYNWKELKTSTSISAAGISPLFFKIATTEIAQNCANFLESNLLSTGGVLTTNIVSKQQWDAPNGWAPLQFIAYQGLKKYNIEALAQKVRKSWLKVNKLVFDTSGKFTEKYNVATTDVLASGGEYPNQDGFGWTNGVFLAFDSEEKM
jgi:alpha,alpha-trehalase